jgi:hypothetical protein
MSEPVQHPRVGELAIYQGVYLPHWEVGHIRVRVPRTKKLLVAAAILTGLGAAYWLGWVNLIELAIFGALLVGISLLPKKERWMAAFPPEFERPHEGRYRMEFEGVVSPRGQYGHMGYLNRVVQITRVLKWERT